LEAESGSCFTPRFSQFDADFIITRNLSPSKCSGSLPNKVQKGSLPSVAATLSLFISSAQSNLYHVFSMICHVHVVNSGP
jgi:hypothetical protein